MLVVGDVTENPEANGINIVEEKTATAEATTMTTDDGAKVPRRDLDLFLLFMTGD